MLQLKSIVDRYRIDAHVADGSAAIVYRVTHVWLHTPMILKHLRADADRAVGHAMLEEGRIQCTHHHQNLVAVHDALMIEDRPALVMEFVNGPDLADWIDERERPPLDQALELFRGIVAGVGEAHRHGLVHRDLKPENVLLEVQPDESWTPKVADFGLAKRLRKSGRSQLTLSAQYSMIGTPEYMAPEQIKSPGTVDHKADLFSLGAILYELVTGQVAFDAEELADVLKLVVTADFRPPLELRPELDPRINQLILDLLKADPRERPASCGRVITVLDRVALTD